MPRGIRLSKTGVLSGDPVGAGTHVIRFKVRDRSVPRQTAYEDLTIIDTAPNGTGCNYIGQDANWVGCDFAGVGFSGYNLSFSDFTDVDFAGAYMSHAELSYDDFYMDNLTGVDFTQSDLTGAAFSDVSELADVIWNNTICPDGTNSDNDGGTCVNNLN